VKSGAEGLPAKFTKEERDCYQFVNDPNCCEQCNAKMAAQQWLARYHAAASSPQPEPSPPQK